MSVEDKAFFVPKAKTADERFAQINAAIIANQGDINTDKQVSGGREPKPENVAYYKAITEARGLGADNPDEKTDDKVGDLGVASFANRLQKNLKKLAAWKTKNNISCYRIYDADLPEYAVAIDLYQGKELWANVQEYDPPESIDPFKANQRLAELLAEIPKVLGIPPDHVFLKIRRKQKSTDQYQKLADNRHFHVVEEHGCKLQVNFEDYLDTGLFLDHRPIRLMIQQQAKGKRFLNLFAYTGSATVHAAVGWRFSHDHG